MGPLAIIAFFAAIAAPAQAAPTGPVGGPGLFWVQSIARNGSAAFNPDRGYAVFRNVKDFGAAGDGTTDDTAAINQAISSGGRCGKGCPSTTTTPALIYFPQGTYLIKSPIVQFYLTQLVGDATNMPIIKAAPDFSGMAAIDSDPYDGPKNFWTNQNNFYRQIRNFVIDMTAVDPVKSPAAAAIHWQVAQATSLQNIVFKMNPSTDPTNQQKGIFMDNGSGGFLTDLVFEGGGIGAFFGSQQFTSRNLTFNNCGTAIVMNWNWLWTLQGVNVQNCKVGINMTTGGPGMQTVGSVVVLDSTFANTPIGVATAYDVAQRGANGTLVLDNVDMTTAPTAVAGASGNTILAGGAKIPFWSQGRAYTGSTGQAQQAAGAAVSKPPSLLGPDGRIFTRSRPQYQGLDAAAFVSVKAVGKAAGDGKTDDSDAIQNVLNSAKPGQVVYFDHGTYLVTKTINVPANVSITGEVWPVILAGGSAFSDMNNPTPVFKVGDEGSSGAVEMSDLIFSNAGAQPGAILVEWNVNAASPGAAGLWDVHFRVGGAAGTQQDTQTCSALANTTAPACDGTFMMLHVTAKSSIYMENVWAWVADHYIDTDKDNADGSGQINVYNGRGMLIESQGPVWGFGTASEHSQMYNYQLSNARNVFFGAMQTETAYMQGAPDATKPFSVNPKYADPDFSNCGGGANCARTWGLRAVGSSDVLVYGAGLYSFFDNYDESCLATESCQLNMVSLEQSPGVQLFGLSTKAATNMVSVNGAAAALDADNRDTFCATVAKFSVQ